MGKRKPVCAGMQAKVRALGYRSVADFFKRNQLETLSRMAEIAGVSLGGVQYHYRRYLAASGIGGKSAK